MASLYVIKTIQLGIFNYNDNLYVYRSLYLLRNFLQSSTAIGRVVNILEDLNGWVLPVNDIRCAYIMFECLADQEDISETCVEFSYYPPCLVFDNNQKIAFQLAETSLNEGIKNRKEQDAESHGNVEIHSL